MGQTVTLNPNLAMLMPLFRERCACIRKIVCNYHEAVSAELIQRLRSNVLRPLTKPTKAQVQEELELLASLSVTIDLIAQGWRIIAISPAVVIEFTNGFSPEAEKNASGMFISLTETTSCVSRQRGPSSKGWRRSA